MVGLNRELEMNVLGFLLRDCPGYPLVYPSEDNA